MVCSEIFSPETERKEFKRKKRTKFRKKKVKEVKQLDLYGNEAYIADYCVRM